MPRNSSVLPRIVSAKRMILKENNSSNNSWKFSITFVIRTRIRTVFLISKPHLLKMQYPFYRQSNLDSYQSQDAAYARKSSLKTGNGQKSLFNTQLRENRGSVAGVNSVTFRDQQNPQSKKQTLSSYLPYILILKLRSSINSL